MYAPLAVCCIFLSHISQGEPIFGAIVDLGQNLVNNVVDLAGDVVDNVLDLTGDILNLGVTERPIVSLGDGTLPTLPGWTLPGWDLNIGSRFDFGGFLKLFGLIGETGLDLGSLIVDGGLDLTALPGFAGGKLDLGRFGIDLPMLQGLGLDFGGLLDSSGSSLELNLAELPGFNGGRLELANLLFPNLSLGSSLPNVNWGGLFTASGQLDLPNIILEPSGNLNLDFLNGLGLAAPNLPSISLPGLTAELGSITLPSLSIPSLDLSGIDIEEFLKLFGLLGKAGLDLGSLLVDGALDLTRLPGYAGGMLDLARFEISLPMLQNLDLSFGGLLHLSGPVGFDCVFGHGLNYKGNTGVTRSGKTCQRWGATSPHNPNDKTKAALADGRLDDVALCRAPYLFTNPDDTFPWCYTTSSPRWEKCDIPQCGGIELNLGDFPGFSDGKLNLGPLLLPGLPSLPNINWDGLFTATGQLNLPEILTSTGALNLDFLSGLGFPAGNLPSLSLPDLAGELSFISLPLLELQPLTIPGLDFDGFLKLFGLLGKTGLDLGKLLVDGKLQLDLLPGFDAGILDLDRFGITLPMLQGLDFDFGGLLDISGGLLELNLGELPGFDAGALDLGQLLLPGLDLPNINWGGLLNPIGQLDLPEILLADGSLNLEFLGGLGIPSAALPSIGLPNLNLELADINLPRLEFEDITGPTLDLEGIIKLLGLLGETGINIGMNVVDGMLDFSALGAIGGQLDLSRFGITLPMLQLLDFDFGGLLDLSGNGLQLNLGFLPGFSGDGKLDLGELIFPGIDVDLPTIDWSGLFTPSGQLDLPSLLLDGGNLDLDFLTGLGFPAASLPTLSLPDLTTMLDGFTLPNLNLDGRIFEDVIELLGLIGKTGLDLGSLMLDDGALNLARIPGFSGGKLDLSGLGITLPMLEPLTLGPALQVSGSDIDFNFEGFPGFQNGKLHLGPALFPGVDLPNINWDGLFTPTGQLNLPDILTPSGDLNLDFLTGLGIPDANLPLITLPSLTGALDGITLPQIELPSLDLSGFLQLFGLLGQTGLDLGSLLIDGALDLTNLPGFGAGMLDLGHLGITLPMLNDLNLDLGGLLDTSSGSLELNLGEIPGFDLDTGSLELGPLLFPDADLPTIDWNGLFNPTGQLDLSEILLPEGGLNLDFLTELGIPSSILPTLTLEGLGDKLELLPLPPITAPPLDLPAMHFEGFTKLLGLLGKTGLDLGSLVIDGALDLASLPGFSGGMLDLSSYGITLPMLQGMDFNFGGLLQISGDGIDLNLGELPGFDTAGKLELGPFLFPGLDLPTIDWGGLFTPSGQLDLPNLLLDNGNLNVDFLTGLGLPAADLPSISLPDLTGTLEGITLPQIELPGLHLGSFIKLLGLLGETGLDLGSLVIDGALDLTGLPGFGAGELDLGHFGITLPMLNDLGLDLGALLDTSGGNLELNLAELPSFSIESGNLELGPLLFPGVDLPTIDWNGLFNPTGQLNLPDLILPDGQLNTEFLGELGIPLENLPSITLPSLTDSLSGITLPQISTINMDEFLKLFGLLGEAGLDLGSLLVDGALDLFRLPGYTEGMLDLGRYEISLPMLQNLDLSFGGLLIVSGPADCVYGHGLNYKGNIGVTRSGRTCQRWGATSPHNPNEATKAAVADGRLDGDVALCRAAYLFTNPDDTFPWCYTTSSPRWEKCDIPACGGIELNLGGFPGFSDGKLSLGPLLLPGMPNLPNINWEGLFTENGQLNLPELLLPGGDLNKDFLTGLGIPAGDLPNISLPDLSSILDGITLPQIKLPTLDLGDFIKLVGLLGETGLDLGSLVIDGALDLTGLPGFEAGELDLGPFGITLPMLNDLGLDLGELLDTSGGNLELNLGELPGFNIDSGNLELGPLLFPGVDLPTIDWNGLFTPTGQLNLPDLILPGGDLNTDFLTELGIPSENLPSITLPGLTDSLSGITLPQLELPGLHLGGFIKLLGLVGETGLDLGSLVIDGALDLAGLPGFGASELDLGHLGITLPMLTDLGLDLGELLDTSGGNLELKLGELPGFNIDSGNLELGPLLFPGVDLPTIDWNGLFTPTGQLNLPDLILPDGGLNTDFLTGIGIPLENLPSITLPGLTDALDLITLPAITAPPLSMPEILFEGSIKLLGLLGETGLDLGSLVVDGALDLAKIPGGLMPGGILDLGSLGITLPMLQELDFNFGGLLDVSAGTVDLNLGGLPGILDATGKLELAPVLFPGIDLPTFNWDGLFTSTGQLNLPELLLSDGNINTDFLVELGLPSLALADLPDVGFPGLTGILDSLNLKPINPSVVPPVVVNPPVVPPVVNPPVLPPVVGPPTSVVLPPVLLPVGPPTSVVLPKLDFELPLRLFGLLGKAGLRLGDMLVGPNSRQLDLTQIPGYSDGRIDLGLFGITAPMFETLGLPNIGSFLEGSGANLRLRLTDLPGFDARTNRLDLMILVGGENINPSDRGLPNVAWPNLWDPVTGLSKLPQLILPNGLWDIDMLVNSEIGFPRDSIPTMPLHTNFLDLLNGIEIPTIPTQPPHPTEAPVNPGSVVNPPEPVTIARPQPPGTGQTTPSTPVSGTTVGDATFDFNWFIRFFGLLGKSGIDFGRLYKDGSFDLSLIPGWNDGTLDLSQLGITAEQLGQLNINFGSLLSGLTLDLTQLPGLDGGELNLGPVLFPDTEIDVDWSLLFSGGSFTTELFNANGRLNMDFLVSLGFPRIELPRIRFRRLLRILNRITLPQITIVYPEIGLGGTLEQVVKTQSARVASFEADYEERIRTTFENLKIQLQTELNGLVSTAPAQLQGTIQTQIDAQITSLTAQMDQMVASLISQVTQHVARINAQIEQATAQFNAIGQTGLLAPGEAERFKTLVTGFIEQSSTLLDQQLDQILTNMQEQVNRVIGDFRIQISNASIGGGSVTVVTGTLSAVVETQSARVTEFQASFESTITTSFGEIRSNMQTGLNALVSTAPTLLRGQVQTQIDAQIQQFNVQLDQMMANLEAQVTRYIANINSQIEQVTDQFNAIGQTGTLAAGEAERFETTVSGFIQQARTNLTQQLDQIMANLQAQVDAQIQNFATMIANASG